MQTFEQKVDQRVELKSAKMVASAGLMVGDASTATSNASSISAPGSTLSAAVPGPTSFVPQAPASSIPEAEMQRAVHSYLSTVTQLALGSRFPLLPLASGLQSGLPSQGPPTVSAMGATQSQQLPVGQHFGPQFFPSAMEAYTQMVPWYPQPQPQQQQLQQQQQQQQPPQRLLANSPANASAYQGSSGPSQLDSWDDASNL
jgi:hypothetical protein